jgi:hypothetical protein
MRRSPAKGRGGARRKSTLGLATKVHNCPLEGVKTELNFVHVVAECPLVYIVHAV